MSIPHPATASAVPARKRRPWWFYLLALFGTGVALVIAAGVALALYWGHLVRTYTSKEPKPVPAVEGVAEKFPELKERWDAYSLLFLHPERDIPSFDLTGEDLNVFASRFGPFGKNSFVEIVEGRFRIQFSAPLDATRNASLQGRYLNGVAMLTPKMTNGQLRIALDTLEANGKALPDWMLRRLRQTNWAERLNERPEFDLTLRALQRIDLTPGKLTLHPRAPGSPR
jgi:hypothetical protein